MHHSGVVFRSRIPTPFFRRQTPALFHFRPIVHHRAPAARRVDFTELLSDIVDGISLSYTSAAVLAAYRTSKGLIYGRSCPSLLSPLPQFKPSPRTELLLRRNSQVIFSLYPSPACARTGLKRMAPKQGTLGYVKSGQQTLGWLSLDQILLRDTNQLCLANSWEPQME